jgi:hypothetical protein
MIAEVVFFATLYSFGIIQRRNRLGILSLFISLYFTGELSFGIFKRETSFTLAQFLWGILFLMGILSVFLYLWLLLFYSLQELRQMKTYVERFKKAIMKSQRIEVISLGAMVLAGGFFGFVSSPSVGQTIIIQPQDYQIEFRIWANYDPAWYQAHPYGTAMLKQLNTHKVTIQNAIFTIRDAEGNADSFSPSIYFEDANKCISTLQWFQDSYPDIRFQFYAYGLGGLSCGNYEGSIYTAPMLKRFVDVYRNSTLKNVVGIYTDWEGPLREAPKYANETLNGWHQALWVDAMAYTRHYFPNWTFSNCFPDDLIWDPMDGDADLQYFDRYNIFMPMWDDYGGMVYRSCSVNKTEQGKDTFRGPWKIYNQAETLLYGTLNNDLSKATMWLGCTGCGPYYNQSNGFENFANDILILKHFGFRTVSIFLGNERFESYGMPTGFFDQYGFEDALDRLNILVNGPNSTKSFTIKSEGDWNPKNKLALDFQLNFDRYEYFPLFSLYLLVGIGSGWIVKRKDQTNLNDKIQIKK